MLDEKYLQHLKRTLLSLPPIELKLIAATLDIAAHAKEAGSEKGAENEIDEVIDRLRLELHVV
jgi:hypothetical protein